MYLDTSIVPIVMVIVGKVLVTALLMGLMSILVDWVYSLSVPVRVGLVGFFLFLAACLAVFTIIMVGCFVISEVWLLG